VKRLKRTVANGGRKFSGTIEHGYNAGNDRSEAVRASRSATQKNKPSRHFGML